MTLHLDILKHCSIVRHLWGLTMFPNAICEGWLVVATESMTSELSSWRHSISISFRIDITFLLRFRTSIISVAVIFMALDE